MGVDAMDFIELEVSCVGGAEPGPKPVKSLFPGDPWSTGPIDNYVWSGLRDEVTGRYAV